MKIIPIADGKFKTLEIIRGAVSQATSGMSIEQMRQRIRVLDAVEGLKEGDASLSLEDADHATLCAAINSIPWAVADRELLALLDNILKPEMAK